MMRGTPENSKVRVSLGSAQNINESEYRPFGFVLIGLLNYGLASVWAQDVVAHQR